MILEIFYLICLAIQRIHSAEELATGFHTRFPLFKMSFSFFLSFEIIFFLFWLSIAFLNTSLWKNGLMSFFILIMFINGIWHMVWWGIEKKYVPGLITAPLFIITFTIFYFYYLI